MSINRVNSMAPPPNFRGFPSSHPADGGRFSEILCHLADGKPSPGEIKTMTSYLQLRMNESLIRAMGGGGYVSPLAFFGGTTYRPESMVTPPARKMMHAAPYPEIIAQASAHYNVDASLIAAVIKAESGGNPRATSPKGAMGMMQLMPATARDLGVTDPYDPGQNIMAGTKYLKKLLDRYDGDRELALAAYNWGPGNLEKSHRSMPRETIEYVARIKKDLEEKA